MSDCRFCGQELEDTDWSNGYCGVCGEELPDLHAHFIKISIPSEDDFSARVSAKVIMRLAENLDIAFHQESSTVILVYAHNDDVKEEFLRNLSECTPEATIVA
jgi:hypothetical protein